MVTLSFTSTLVHRGEGRGEGSYRDKAWVRTLRWCQGEARSAVQKAAAHEEWTLTAARLAALAPELAWRSFCGSLSVAGGDTSGQRGLWLLAIQQILNFNQGQRIRTCADCGTIFVGRTTANYCDLHSTSVEKVRRYRERLASTLSPIQQKERRQRYYDNPLRKNKGRPAVIGARNRLSGPGFGSPDFGEDRAWVGKQTADATVGGEPCPGCHATNYKEKGPTTGQSC